MRHKEAQRSTQFSLSYLLVVVIAICMVLAIARWWYQAADNAREDARRSACIGHLRYIAVAIANYESSNGCFPPALIADEEGKPMHSWRVLLLPYMGYKSVYDRYDFSEPWDGPNNRKLASEVSSVWSCPSDAKKPTQMTSYVAVTGPGTIWPGATGAKLSDVKDGVSKTILLVELRNSDIHWMEPRDLSIDDVVATGLTSGHPDTINVVYVDALAVGIRKEELTPQNLEGLLTIDGSEQVPGFR